MTTANHISRASLRLAICLGLSVLALGVRPVLAQTPRAADAAEAKDKLEEVVVTGSRIPQANLASVSPITAVDQADIKVSGTSRIEDLLDSLPQVSPSENGNVGNLATGTATVSLRNLGPNRTLVLMDGRRLAPGDPSSQAGGPYVDLNSIPSALVQRVEVLTGGASAVYGSDAVAGVVNFIMVHDFQGIRLDADAGVYEHSNDNAALRSLLAAQAATNPANYVVPPSTVWQGGTGHITLIGGINTPDQKGNITAYASYLKNNGVFQSKYDYGACGFNSGPSFSSCGGSIVNATGDFLIFDPASNSIVQSLTVDPKTGNTFRNFDPSKDLYNGAGLNNYLRPDKRYDLGLFSHYEFNKALDIYGQVMYTNDKTSYLFGPSGIFGAFSGTFTLDCSNPLLSAQERATVCGNGVASVDYLLFRRNVEGGSEGVDFNHTSTRMLLGAKGEFGGGWMYDIYAQYSQALLFEVYFNDMSHSRVPLALDAVVNPANGQIVCRAVLTGVDPNCVPYNPFTVGGITPAALAYVQQGGIQAGGIRETDVNATVNNNLGQYGIASPWANEGFGISLGAEYRRQRLNFHPSESFTSGDLTGAGQVPAQAGGYEVHEFFGELRAPLVADRILAKQLTVEGAYRYSQYQDFTAGTSKLGIEWAPTQDVRLRSSYERAVRAPNVYELFTADRLIQDGLTDPCAGANPSATQAQCALTGVTAAQYGKILPSPGGYNGLIGGNPSLGPEKANTVGAGIVLTPRFIPDFSLSLDWFDIKVRGAIGPIGADTILQDCISSASSFFCNLIHRSPVNGSLWISPQGYVQDTVVNVGSLRTKGLDAEVHYRVNLGARNRLLFDFIGTWTDSWNTAAVEGDTPVECAGFYGPVCGLPIPTWRHRLRTTWSMPWNVDVSATWRRTSAVRLGTENDPATSPATDLRISAFDYFDLAATWKITEKVSVRGGINNVADKQPPVIGRANLPFGIGNGNTFPQLYDALGRFVFVGVTANF